MAAALPGGDPLAAALAAGETPSPEMVAAASDEGSIRPGLAVLALIGAAVLLAAAVVVYNRATSPLSFERSPYGLADRARDLLARLGCAEKPEGRAWGYIRDRDLQLRINTGPTPELVSAARAGRAPIVRFWYRESPQHLVPDIGDRVTPDDPPVRAAGASVVQMSTDGRLLSVRVVPGPDSIAGHSAAEADWAPLFEAAGLDPSRFVPAPPRSTPPDFADSRAAWTGHAPDLPEARLRVEAAALQGAPVFFRLGLDEPAGASAPPPGAVARMRLFFLLLAILFASIVCAALWLARQNLASGRGDRKGAGRVAVAVFAVEVLNWLASGSHAPVLGELWFLLRHLALYLLEAAIVWLLYVALEPLVRRAAPAGLVSWTRLLAGRVRDPLVGRDLLLGSLMGIAYFFTFSAAYSWEWASGRSPVLTPEVVTNLIGAPGLIRGGVSAVVTGFVQAMGFTILWQLLSGVLRSPIRARWPWGPCWRSGCRSATGSGCSLCSSSSRWRCR